MGRRDLSRRNRARRRTAAAESHALLVADLILSVTVLPRALITTSLSFQMGIAVTVHLIFLEYPTPSLPLDCSASYQPPEFIHENIFPSKYYRPRTRQKNYPPDFVGESSTISTSHLSTTIGSRHTIPDPTPEPRTRPKVPSHASSAHRQIRKQVRSGLHQTASSHRRIDMTKKPSCVCVLMMPYHDDRNKDPVGYFCTATVLTGLPRTGAVTRASPCLRAASPQPRGTATVSDSDRFRSLTERSTGFVLWFLRRELVQNGVSGKSVLQSDHGQAHERHIGQRLPQQAVDDRRTNETNLEIDRSEDGLE